MALLIDFACVSACVCVCVFQILMEHVQEQYYELMSFLTFLKLSSSYFAAFFFFYPVGCSWDGLLVVAMVTRHDL